jgi:hypothetical protein
LNIGPVSSHIITTATAIVKAQELPTILVTRVDKRSKKFCFGTVSFMGLNLMLYINPKTAMLLG